MVGIIFSKLSRPKKRAATLMFSKNAVVCQRDGTNCLLFRVGNMRLSSLVEAHVRAILISKKVTREGEVIPYAQTELTVGTDSEGEEEELFFIWPTTIIHKINSDSPFYDMSAKDFLKKRYEIVVILEGVVEQTGNSIQARSSYLPNEVLWGYRFVNLLTFKHSASEYKIDYSAFNSVYKVDLSPLCQKVKDELSDGDQHINDGSDDDAADDDDQETKCTKSTSSQIEEVKHPECQCYHRSPRLSPVNPPLTPSLPCSNHLLPPGPFHPAQPVPRNGEPGKKYCVEILHMV